MKGRFEMIVPREKFSGILVNCGARSVEDSSRGLLSICG